MKIFEGLKRIFRRKPDPMEVLPDCITTIDDLEQYIGLVERHFKFQSWLATSLIRQFVERQGMKQK